MLTRWIGWMAVSMMLVLGACGGSDSQAGFDSEEEPAEGATNNGNSQNNNGGASTNNGTGGPPAIDYCAEFGWYDDGVCDDFCARPDPDCGSQGETCPDPDDPTVHYRFESDEDPSVCEVADFACQEDQRIFSSDDCGCGCIDEEPVEPTPVACPDPDDPEVHYVGEDPDECATIFVACPDHQEAFSDECGCGCLGPEEPATCPDPDDPNVSYVNEDPDQCKLIDFDCAANQTYFNDDCGCGCIAHECQDDGDCPNGYCEIGVTCTGTGCPPPTPNACVYPDCGDGSQVSCNLAEPTCADDETSAVRNGCWECVDARTCN